MTHWKLVFTHNTLMTICGAFALVLIPLGAVLFINSQAVSEVAFDYTKCSTTASSTFAAPASSVTGADSVTQWRYDPNTKTCTVQFRVPKSLSGTIYMYVRITNMYQNNRLYVKSQDADQLAGKVYRSAGDIPSSGETNCAFLQYANCSTASQFSWSGNSLSHAESNPDCLRKPYDAVLSNADPKAQYYPCGLIANSMFSDDISNLTCVDTNCRLASFGFSEKGIAWNEDSSLYRTTGWRSDPSLQSQIPTMLIPPPQWRQAWPTLWGNGYNSSNLPDLANWERFQVWMRKAGLPTFRKLWGRNNGDGLDAGLWQISIVDKWNCRRFDGTKSLVFSQASFLGTKNNFMGIAFLAVGGICGFFVILAGVYRPRKLGDHAHLSWVKSKAD
nr:hypothetical protein HK105_003879 [Polyrhizophydium stewartii]